LAATLQPKLNLTEGLWGSLKRSALNNYFLESLTSLERAAHETFANLQRRPETTLSLAYRFDAK